MLPCSIKWGHLGPSCQEQEEPQAEVGVTPVEAEVVVIPVEVVMAVIPGEVAAILKEEVVATWRRWHSSCTIYGGSRSQQQAKRKHAYSFQWQQVKK